MVFCNKKEKEIQEKYDAVTILILIDGFLQCGHTSLGEGGVGKVTILILIDGFLQYSELYILEVLYMMSQSLF